MISTMSSCGASGEKVNQPTGFVRMMMGFLNNYLCFSSLNLYLLMLYHDDFQKNTSQLALKAPTKKNIIPLHVSQKNISVAINEAHTVIFLMLMSHNS